MPTTSESADVIDRALALGAASTNAFELTPEPSRIKRWLIAALVCHLLVGGLLVIWRPVWIVQSGTTAGVADDRIEVEFVEAARLDPPKEAPPVPVPAPAPAPAPAPTKPVPAPVPDVPAPVDVVVQSKPVATPPAVSAPVPPPADVALQRPAPPAVAADAEATAAEAQAAITQPIRAPVARAPERSEPPALIERSRVAPIYPRASRRAGEAGTVVLRLTVGVSGTVLATDVLSSSGFDRLDQAAQAAVRQWRFSPGTRQGVPVELSIQVPIRFELQ
jgi:periplasmic protein TonB